MASLITGYEYDIFISYRQKDNKYDGWVTEFVDHLKKELEATFKEEISVYFDINPNDGLLETDDVDASLKDKLRCLVFIPIISRTYCDPRSFAWEHEFKTFVELSSNDRFGLKVRLPNGNVAGRVLPVRIHELDEEDVKQCEAVLGGVLRGVEFIYKSPGVNRPLLPREENPLDNLNHTNYRDQINKVANVIREITSSMRNPDRKVSGMPANKPKHEPLQLANRKVMIIAGSLFLLALVLIGYFFLPEIFKNPDKNAKSIAVLPFENLGVNKEDDWFGEAMTDETITQLYKIREFDVKSRTSVMQYLGTEKTVPVIGKELNVNYLIEGSVQRIEDHVRVNVNLVNAVNDNHLWGDTYERNWEDIASLQSVIAKQIAEELQTVLTPEETRQIEKSQKNPEAYNSFLLGRFYLNKRTPDGLKKSIELFSKSVGEDPEYAEAYAGMADAYYILAWWGWYPRKEGYSKAREYALRALEIDKTSADAHAVLGTLLCWSEWKWDEARKELKLATELNRNSVNAHQYYSEFLDIIRDNREAREEINIALKLDPFSTAVNATSALYYYNEGNYDEAINAYRKTLEINPSFHQANIMNFEIYFRKGDTLNASESIQQYMLGDSLTSPVAAILKQQYNASGIRGVLAWLIGWQKENPAAYLYVAKWYAMLGNKTEAIVSLSRIIELHSSEVPATNIYPDEIPRIYNSPGFDNIRSEPGFQEIIRKMGLSEYQPVQ